MKLSPQTSVRFQLAQTPATGQPPQSRPRTADQTQRRWIACLVLLAFTWRMIGLTTQNLTQVELDTVRLATSVDSAFTSLISQEQNGWLYFLFMRPWLQFFGTDPFSLRYISVIAATTTIALMWQVARRMVPAVGSAFLRNLPLLSTLLLVANPNQLRYGQEGGVYALAAALTLLSSWSWLQAMWYSGLWRWLAYLLVTSIALYTHLATALLLPVHLTWFLLANPLNRNRWKGYGLALVGFLLPLLPLTQWGFRYLAAGNLPNQADASPLQNSFSSLPSLPLAEMARTLLLNHTQGNLDSPSQLWLIPVFFLGLTGLLVGYTEFGGRITNVAMLATWLILPVLLIYAITLFTPIFPEPSLTNTNASAHVDSFVWIAPAFTMFLALGAQVLRRAYGSLGGWLSVGLILFVVTFWGYSWWEQTQRPISNPPDQASRIHTGFSFAGGDTYNASSTATYTQ